jgi:Cu/Ag efflux protein CusF
MRKIFSSAVLFLLLFSSFSYAGESKTVKASGEVVTVDPLYSKITLETGAILGFSGGGKAEFEVASKELLSGLSARDIIEFEISGARGEAKITAIKKMGQAPVKDNSTAIGKVMQDVLTGTGEVVKTVTSPIPPVRDTLGEAVGTATEGTGNLVSEAKSDLKRDF